MHLIHAVTLTLMIAASTATAALAGPWEVRSADDGNRAAVSNDDKSITVTIFCGGDGAMVSITHSKTVPWLKNQATELVIDGETFPLAAAREGDTFGIFNLSPKTLKPALVGALRTGAAFEIAGTATGDIEAGALEFTLEGSSRALDQVAGGCT